MTIPDAPRHGVIEYDDQDEWLTESDGEGASRIVARDVPRWLGRFVEAAIASQPEPLDAAPCWFCKTLVPVEALIAGYDTFDEARLACLACNERMSGNWRPRGPR